MGLALNRQPPHLLCRSTCRPAGMWRRGWGGAESGPGWPIPGPCVPWSLPAPWEAIWGERSPQGTPPCAQPTSSSVLCRQLRMSPQPRRRLPVAASQITMNLVAQITFMLLQFCGSEVWHWSHGAEIKALAGLVPFWRGNPFPDLFQLLEAPTLLGSWPLLHIQS